MLTSCSAIENEFHPRYSTSWYIGVGLSVVVAIAYVRSKLLGETLEGIIDILGVTAIGIALFSVLTAIKRIEFGSRIAIKRFLWFSTYIAYDHILEIRLPEMEIELRNKIKLDNIANLDELQQIFKDCELIGFIPKGRVKELNIVSRFTLKLRWKRVLWGIFAIVAGIPLILGISNSVSIFWVIVVCIFLVYDVFEKLFGKDKNE
jgi:hypothetical protein